MTERRNKGEESLKLTLKMQPCMANYLTNNAALQRLAKKVCGKPNAHKQCRICNYTYFKQRS